MTEQNVDATSEPAVDNVDNSTEAAATKPVVTPEVAKVTEQPVEKVLKQSEVNKIVGDAKLSAYEKGRREAALELATKEEHERKQAEKKEEPTVGQTQDSNITMSPEEVRKLINEEAEKQAQLKLAQQSIDTFVSKMEAGPAKYQDFDEVVGKLQLSSLAPHILQNMINMANAVDNSAEVMYEIARNPSKFGTLTNLMSTAPVLAFDEFKKLSDSIKTNQEAAKSQSKVAPEPLDQTKPSTTGTDNGEMSVSDYRKQEYLRG